MLGTTKSSEKLFSYYLHCLNIIKLHSRLRYLNKLSDYKQGFQASPKF